MPYDVIHLLRKPGFTVRKVGDARMIIPTGPRMKEYKGVITVNETGAFMFDLIKEEKQVPDLVQALIVEYGIEEETAFQAVSAFVEQCHTANLLVVDTVEELDPTKPYYMTDEMAKEVDQQLARRYAESTSESDEFADS